MARVPCRIIDLLSPTVFKVEHVHTHRVYTRSIMNVSAWHGGEATIADLPAPTPASFGLDDVQAGSIIAVLDAADDEEFSLAAVTSIVNDDVHVHYMYTRQKSLKTAKFQLAYVQADGNVLLHKRRRTKKKKVRFTESDAPWTGIVPLAHDFILVPDIRLRPNGILRTPSLRALEAIVGLLHKKHRRH